MDRLNKEFKSYIPFSEEDLKWGLCVQGAGCTSVPANYPSYPVTTHPTGYQYSWDRGRTFRDEYALLYITYGRGVFESIHSGELKVDAGSVFILFPEVWHRYRPSRSTGWDEFWITFRGEVMDRLMRDGSFSPMLPVLDVGLNEELLDQFQQCDQLCELQPIGFRQLLSARATMILALVQALARRREIGDVELEGSIRKARFLIAEHLDRDMDMAVLAKDFHLSYPHFRRLFKRYTGLAPSQYHLQLRLNKARELLRGTSLSVKQVSAQLGFDNPYYFSRIFKKKTGLSPGKWR